MSRIRETVTEVRKSQLVELRRINEALMGVNKALGADIRSWKEIGRASCRERV